MEQSDARRLRRQEEEEDDDDESDVDEEGEPWLREGNASNLFDADNPYLQDLDEEDLPDMNSPQDSLPLLPSASLLGSSSRVEEKQQGWLSLDLGNAPAPPPRLATSPPLSPSSARSHLMSPPTRTTLSESLLPRDGLERSVFHLPDPDRPLPMNKYNDSQWTAIWCGSLLACGLGAIIIFFTTTVGSLYSSCFG